MKTKFALISGASTGLGKEFAIACAKRGFNLILISLPGTNLPGISKRIQQEYGVEVQPFQLDLTDKQALEKMVSEVNSLNLPVNLLINNAGMGGTTEILNASAEYIEKIILLNVLATTLLTRLLLPILLKQPESFVLNVSSMAAFSPIPFKTIYPASKSFIQSFSLSLREELQGSSVSVSVVNPGPILTNYDTARRIIDQGSLARMSVLTAGEIANYALEKCLQKDPVIIPGYWNKFNHLLMKLIPDSLKARILSGVIRREIRGNAVKCAV